MKTLTTMAVVLLGTTAAYSAPAPRPAPHSAPHTAIAPLHLVPMAPSRAAALWAPAGAPAAHAAVVPPPKPISPHAAVIARQSAAQQAYQVREQARLAVYAAKAQALQEKFTAEHRPEIQRYLAQLAKWQARAAEIQAKYEIKHPTLVEPPLAAASPTYMINHGAYGMLDAASKADLAKAAKQYFIVGPSTNLATLPPNAVPTLTFTSYIDMANAIAAGIDPAIKAVVLDIEDWAATPVAEQLKPAEYYKLAERLAHKNGLTLIATPAINLVNAIEPTFTGDKYTEFERLGLAGAIAQYSDVYEIQAQQIETNTAQFASFVTTIAGQVNAAQPNITVLAGISTNPAGASVTSAQVFASVSAVLTAVNGYWINIPAASPSCPSCGAPQPAVADGVLQDLQ